MQNIPASALSLLQALECAGFQAYLVGGCVRDLLMGRTPEDWDITTSAKPEELMALFGQDAIPTGLSHGTVTVRWQDTATEITTFRQDGSYSDHRHPDRVRFTASLEEDLSRRDFTVNAMALDRQGRLTDPFGGQADLAQRRLRCVGEAAERFAEDALRIMRALRFSSVLALSPEPQTAQAIHEQKHLLSAIAPERIEKELRKLLCGAGAGEVLREFWDVLCVFFPEIRSCVGFDQRNPHHCYELWEHTVRSLEAIAPTPVLRYTMLFHDWGKPGCCVTDSAGHRHFPGHPQRSAQMAEAAMERLRFDTATKEDVLQLVRWHDYRYMPQRKTLRRLLSQLGEENAYRLIQVQSADNAAQAPGFSRQEDCELARQILDTLVEERCCVSLAQLAVNGNDLMALGYQGKEVGRMLQSLLDLVIQEELPNDREALLSAAKP